jgi:phosphohistidine swiveling domain-containing protein
MIIKHKYIFEISSKTEPDPEKLGGKGLGLVNLMKLGGKVSKGFIISSELFIDHISKLLGISWQSLQKYDEFDYSAMGIEKKILASTLPMSVEMGIEAYLSGMKTSNGFIVRSSAVGEDSSETSMAGIYDSYTNLGNIKSIIEGIKRVWVSTFSEKSISYLRAMKIDRIPSMAVVIQEMVNGKVSGVAFTANPENGSFYEMVINCSRNSCEGIVGGYSPYESYKIIKDKFTFEELIGKVSDQGFTVENERLLEMLPEGETILSSVELFKMGSIFLKLEEGFRFPQDIEWSLDDSGEIFLFQSRPMTGLYFHNIEKKGVDESRKEIIFRTIFTSQFLPFNELAKSVLRVGLGRYLEENSENKEIYLTFLSNWAYIGVILDEDDGEGEKIIKKRLELIRREEKRVESPLRSIFSGWRNPIKKLNFRKDTPLEDELKRNIESYSRNFIFLKPSFDEIKEHIEFFFSIVEYGFGKELKKFYTMMSSKGSSLILDRELLKMLKSLNRVIEKNHLEPDEFNHISIEEMGEFFIEKREIFQRMIVRRECELNFYRNMPVPPNVVSLSDEYVSPDSNGELMNGRGIGGEIAVGRVFVYDGSFKGLRDGDVLVSRFSLTECAEFFDKIIAFVVEDGKLLTHANIVAREMKIPTVIGVNNVTKWLKNGDEAVVDGRVGYIKRIDSNLEL